MEFTIQSDALSKIPAEIPFNYEELKTQLTEQLKYYKGLVVTVDAIKDAKKDRASLNKLVTVIESKRKQIKQECLAPYEGFEKKVKEIVGMIQEPILAIDGQVKEFENAQKQKKYEDIQSHYNENVGELSELITLERVIPEKWGNAGMPLKEVCESISKLLNKINSDIKILRALKSAYEQNMIDVYLRDFDMSATLAEQTRLEEQQAALERHKAQSTPEPLKPATEPISQPVAPQTAPIEAKRSDLKDVRVVFYDTTQVFREEMKRLAAKHGIRYGAA